LIKEIYFAITTLSTIGYGDFHPVSQIERSIAAFILLWGVTIFSFIMGQFIEILMNYKSLWKVGKHKDLSKWIALLSRFNNGNPLNKELITKIEDFFDYYWLNNRMSAIENEMDQRFMDELPFYVQGEIIIDTYSLISYTLTGTTSCRQALKSTTLISRTPSMTKR